MERKGGERTLGRRKREKVRDRNESGEQKRRETLYVEAEQKVQEKEAEEKIRGSRNPAWGRVGERRTHSGRRGGRGRKESTDLFLLDGERGVMCHGMRGETSISAKAKEIGAGHQLHHEGSE